MATVIVNSGETYSVKHGQTDSNDVVLNGGTMLVLSGGEADLTTVSLGGVEIISAGGRDVGASIFWEQDVFGTARGMGSKDGRAPARRPAPRSLRSLPRRPAQ